MKVARVNINLPSELREFVEGEIKAGRFKNTNEAICGGIRLLKQREDLAAKLRSSNMTDAASGQDIEAIVFIVMMEAANSAQQDLMAIMAHVKAMTAAKAVLRSLMSKVNKDIADNAGQRDGRPSLRFDPCGVGSESGYHSMPVPYPDPGSPGGLRLVPTDMHKGRITDVCVLRAIGDELLYKLDSMSELSDVASLRLQMIMDRRSKLISTLSNIIKKISETQDTMVANLK